MAIEVTVRDTETGKAETATIKDDYIIVVAGNTYLDGIRRYSNGTVILTIKKEKS